MNKIIDTKDYTTVENLTNEEKVQHYKSNALQVLVAIHDSEDDEERVLEFVRHAKDLMHQLIGTPSNKSAYHAWWELFKLENSMEDGIFDDRAIALAIQKVKAVNNE